MRCPHSHWCCSALRSVIRSIGLMTGELERDIIRTWLKELDIIGMWIREFDIITTWTRNSSVIGELGRDVITTCTEQHDIIRTWKRDSVLGELELDIISTCTRKLDIIRTWTRYSCSMNWSGTSSGRGRGSLTSPGFGQGSLTLYKRRDRQTDGRTEGQQIDASCFRLCRGRRDKLPPHQHAHQAYTLPTCTGSMLHCSLQHYVIMSCRM